MTGNKFKHILASALLILPLALQVFAGASTVKAEGDDTPADTTNAYIALHKVSWDKGKAPAEYGTDEVFKNDGDLVRVPDLEGGTLLNGVEFTAYDVTKTYESQSGSVKDRQKYIQDNATSIAADAAKLGQVVGEPQVTAGEGDNAGTANFTLPEKSKADSDKYAVYLILETRATTRTVDASSTSTTASSSDSTADKPDAGTDTTGEATGSSKTVVDMATPIVLVMPLSKMGTKGDPVNIYPKNETETTLDKDLTEESKATMDGADGKGKNAVLGLGDTAHYTVTAVVPSDIATLDTYKITDTPDLGLNIVQDSIKISDGSANPATLPDATITETTATGKGTGFTLEYKPQELAKANAGGHELTITYDATINRELIPNVDLLNNSLKLNNEPNIVTSRTPITTGGAQFVKKESGTGKALGGAEFLVVKDGQYLAETGEPDKTQAYSWKDLPEKYDVGTEADKTTFPDAKVLISKTADENTSEEDVGKFEIYGLNYGDYQLYEIKAPEGHVLLGKPVDFKVNATSYDHDKSVDTKVENAPKGELPHTGGMGIYIVIAVGLAIALAGVAFLRRGKHHEEV